MFHRKSHIKSKINKIKPKASILKKAWFWLSLLAIIIIGAVMYFALFYPGIQLENFVILGNTKVKTGDLQKDCSDKSILNIIKYDGLSLSTRSILTASLSSVSKSILSDFPIIEKVDIKKKFPQTLVVNVVERSPLGVMCADEKHCFLVDGNGIAYEELADTAGYTIVYQNPPVNVIRPGQKVIDINKITAIYKIQKTLLGDFKIMAQSADIVSDSRINVKTDAGWYVYFDSGPESDIDWQLTRLKLLLSGGLTDEQIKSLRYIDLRPKDKAIICDNETCGK